MNIFKRETLSEKIDRLEIKLAGMLSMDETSQVLIKSKVPMYIVDNFIKNRVKIAEIRKELEILKTKLILRP
jgi:hypothetical protein